MERMVRKQLYLRSKQDAELTKRARSLGVSQAELVRAAIDRFLAEDQPDSRALAWAEARATMESAGTLRTGSGGRRWTRDELHER